MFRKALLTSLLFLILDLVLQLLTESHSSMTLLSFLLSFFTSFSFWILVSSFLSLFKSSIQKYLIFITSFIINLLFICSLHAYLKLGDYISAYHLVYLTSDFGFAINQFYLGLQSWHLLIVVFSYMILLKIWWPQKNQDSYLQKFKYIKIGLLIFLSLLIFLVGVKQLKFETVGQRILPDASFFLAMQNYKQTNQFNVLHSSKRIDVENTLSKNISIQPDILLFIGESFSKKHLQFYSENQQIISESTPYMTELFTSPNSIVFSQALSNSSATDVSIPSLIASVGPEESDVKLHEMPLAWDWLKSQGYFTVFISSQKFSFANMNTFLLSPGPDLFLTADRFNSIQRFSKLNNNIDDLLAAESAIDIIKKNSEASKKPVLIIYFSNTTHYPFIQTSEKLIKQPQFQTKYENSLFITDQTFKLLNEYVKQRQRPLISMITADHGELEHITKATPRIASFYDEIISIPFAWHFSDELIQSSETNKCFQSMLKNKKTLVQNLDIVPTLIDLLKINNSSKNLNTFNKLTGKSLCQDLELIKDSRNIISLNTNNIRRWNPEGFLIAQNQFRYVYTTIEGPQLFNVALDPKEENNLLKKEPTELIQKLKIYETIDSQLHLKRMWNEWNNKKSQ